MCEISYTQLLAFCALANKAIRAYYGRRDSCVFSTGVVCEVLAHFGFKAVPLRVTAKVFHPEPRKYGCVLGSDGGGERMPTASPDN